MEESGRLRRELRERSGSGWEPTVLCAAALLAAAVFSIAGPAGLAWGGEPAAQGQPPREAADRVESRTAHDVEMLRRLLEMTLQSTPAGSSAPAARVDGAESPPPHPEVPAPSSAARGADSVPCERGCVG